MSNLGMPELMFIFLIVLLLFGGKKIPELARGLGKGVREFKKAKDGVEEAIQEETKPAAATAEKPAADALAAAPKPTGGDQPAKGSGQGS